MVALLGQTVHPTLAQVVVGTLMVVSVVVGTLAVLELY
jgi:hypothetical protein